MKWKPERSSYLLGVFGGISIGVAGGYAIALRQVVGRLESDRIQTVSLSISALRKLEKSDAESASRLFRLTIASEYYEFLTKSDDWWINHSRLRSHLILEVRNAADELPGLKQALEDEARKRNLSGVP